MSFHVPEGNRLRTGDLASDESYGNNGAFFIPFKSTKKAKRSPAGLWIIASDGEGWEHVSVSTPNRTPFWHEMCSAKALFWDAQDCVVQYHPPEIDYIDNHPHTLHLWRPVAPTKLERPPWELVGLKNPTKPAVEAAMRRFAGRSWR